MTMVMALMVMAVVVDDDDGHVGDGVDNDDGGAG
jgi:hypothetical protein